MTDMLGEVLDAAEAGRWKIEGLKEWHLSLVSERTFDRTFFEAAIPRFVSAVRERLGMSLRLIGGGDGCAAFEFSIEHHDVEELKKMARETMGSAEFQAIAQQASFVALRLRVVPFGEKNLITGEIWTAGSPVWIGDRNIATYDNRGQAGIIGPQGYMRQTAQIWNGIIHQAGAVDFDVLAEQLGRLRAELRAISGGAEHDEALGAIAGAEIAAKQKDGSKVVEALSKVGKWTLDIAEKIGVPLALSVLKAALGV